MILVFNFSALFVRDSALESRQSFRGDPSCLKVLGSYFKENRKMVSTHNYPVLALSLPVQLKGFETSFQRRILFNPCGACQGAAPAAERANGLSHAEASGLQCLKSRCFSKAQKRALQGRR